MTFLNPKRVPRGPTRYWYTQEDVARLAGVSLNQARRAQYRREFRWRNFRSVLCWILVKRSMAGLAALFGDEKV